MKGDKNNKMFKLWSNFMEKNEKKIINDFCSKIKNEIIGDLTLDEYSQFRFWRYHSSEQLKPFYKTFKKETKSNIPYTIFCELLWNSLDGIILEGLEDMDNAEFKKIISSMSSTQTGEA